MSVTINPMSLNALLTSVPLVRFKVLIPSIPLTPFVTTTMVIGSTLAPAPDPVNLASLSCSPIPNPTAALETGINILSSVSIASPM